MAVQVSYPGVYIEEFTAGAPIEGVGTSTAAFLAKWAPKPLMPPTKLTSWDAFVREFAGGYIPEDTDFLWYAVRGFFENGGRVCFVTAVSNAAAGSVELPDQATTPQKTVVITARAVGQLSPPIEVESAAVNAVTAELFHPSYTVTAAPTGGTKVTVDTAAHAQQFLPGNQIRIGTTANNELAIVVRVENDEIFTASPIVKTHAATAKVRLAPLLPFATTFRVENAADLAKGSIATLSQTGVTPATRIVQDVREELIPNQASTYLVTVDNGINGFDPYGSNPVTLKSEEFTLTVTRAIPGTPYSKAYEKLSMSPAHPKYYVSIINNDPDGLVVAAPYDPPNTTLIPKNRPVTTAKMPLTGGENHDPSKINANHYKRALARLEPIDDINMVAAPDATDAGVQTAVVDHCFRMHDRFAILDSQQNAKPAGPGSIETQRAGVQQDKGFAALYYPWLEVLSEKTGKRITVPPSGHVAGIYARTDNNRGVHKAPAGVETTVGGALGVERLLSDTDQGELNKIGINVIRVFQSGGRPVVWGARTTSDVTDWRYVNIRRLFLFLEESIEEGIRWALFEPNTQALWKKLNRTITAFLTQQWRDGALYGAKPEEAFYVRIDEVLNPDNERALGRLYIEIGIRPAYPAEFIIVRIGIWPGGSEVSES